MNAEINLYALEKFGAKTQAFDFGRILNRELDGFIVEDFLDEREIASVLSGFRNLGSDELVHIDAGFDSYPMSFAQFDQLVRAKHLSENDYLQQSSHYIASFAKRFGVDVFAKLKSLFVSMQHAPELCLAPNKALGGHYIPFTFRELFPGEGCLKAHCENLFLREFPGFFERINTFSKPDQQLSFFIVLQSPGAGGELTLFDILWNEEQKRLGDHDIKLEDERHFAFDDVAALRRDYIKPRAGSLVIFSGGDIWHRIETIRQAPSRITLGGFLSFSHDHTKLYCWS